MGIDLVRLHTQNKEDIEPRPWGFRPLLTERQDIAGLLQKHLDCLRCHGRSTSCRSPPRLSQDRRGGPWPPSSTEQAGRSSLI